MRKRGKLSSCHLGLRLIRLMVKNHKRLNEDIENNYKICGDICREIVDRAPFDLHVKGKENIPAEGPVMIVSNHRCFFDIILMLSVVKKTMSFVAAAELYHYPVLRDYMRGIGCVPIVRGTENIKQMNEQLHQISRRVKEGGIVIFPEGECDYKNQGIKEFKRGGFVGTIREGLQIVPAYIRVDKTGGIGRWMVPLEEAFISFGRAFSPVDPEGRKFTSGDLAGYCYDRVKELELENF